MAVVGGTAFGAELVLAKISTILFFSEKLTALKNSGASQLVHM